MGKRIRLFPNSLECCGNTTFADENSDIKEVMPIATAWGVEGL